MTGGIGPETQTALENIKKIVELGGFQMTDVVTVNVYLADDWRICRNEQGLQNHVP